MQLEAGLGTGSSRIHTGVTTSVAKSWLASLVPVATILTMNHPDVGGDSGIVIQSHSGML